MKRSVHHHWPSCIASTSASSPSSSSSSRCASIWPSATRMCSTVSSSHPKLWKSASCLRTPKEATTTERCVRRYLAAAHMHSRASRHTLTLTRNRDRCSLQDFRTKEIGAVACTIGTSGFNTSNKRLMCNYIRRMHVLCWRLSWSSVRLLHNKKQNFRSEKNDYNHVFAKLRPFSRAPK